VLDQINHHLAAVQQKDEVDITAVQPLLATSFLKLPENVLIPSSSCAMANVPAQPQSLHPSAPTAILSQQLATVSLPNGNLKHKTVQKAFKGWTPLSILIDL
jgi:hypothetical protein